MRKFYGLVICYVERARASRSCLYQSTEVKRPYFDDKRQG
jgi:hypothetical protein